MSYGIQSAKYASADGLSVVAATASMGAVLISEKDRPALWEELQAWVKTGGVIAPYAPPADPAAEELEQQALAALNATGGADLWKLLKAKVVSDLAHRLGKAPAALTAGELQTERNRIAAIYKNL